MVEGARERREESGARTNRRVGLLAAVGVAVLLGCLLATGALYLQARDRIGRLLPQISLQRTVVMRADGPAIVRRIQALSKLETSRYTLEKIIDAESNSGWLPRWLVGEKLIFIAHGEVAGGIDLGRLGADDVTISGDHISLRLPEPEVLYTRLDNERSRVYNRESGLLTRPDEDLESRVRATAERTLRASALEDGVLQSARENARKSLGALLGSLGYERVTFPDADGDGATPAPAATTTPAP